MPHLRKSKVAATSDLVSDKSQASAALAHAEPDTPRRTNIFLYSSSRFQKLLTVITLGSLCLRSLLTTQAAEHPGNIEVDSPEIHADRQVTFRLAAPSATKVKLRGIQHEPVKMKKDKHGVWSATVGPMAPGIYGYSFVVDGDVMLDPSNPEIKPERDPDESELEIPSSTPLLTQWQEVPHGTVHLNDYFSPTLKRVRHLRIYTPPGYETETDMRWPVLYLMHGTGDTEATWTEFGRANYISDNLIARQACQPAIIVMPDGHAYLHDEEGDGQRNLEAMEADVLEAVVPFVDHLYRTVPDANHRAICGLSMGGFQSMFIGLRNQKTFAWVAGMSAYVPDVEKVCVAALKNPAATNANLRLFWHQIGRNDDLLADQRKFEAALEKHGIKRQFRVTAGDHDWDTWRGYLAELLPVLFK
ncbi:MAG: alpha/beta hydrolase-fold protein [Verrucomicrobiota bacterium]